MVGVEVTRLILKEKTQTPYVVSYFLLRHEPEE